MKGKKGALPAMGVIAMIMLAGIGAFFAVEKYVVDPMSDWFSDEDQGDALTITKDGETQVVTDPDNEIKGKELTSCDGIQDVNALYDDINAYKVGTDPGGNLTIYEKDGKFFKQVVQDDATSTGVPYLSSFKGLAGNTVGTPISSYFSEVIDFDTSCSNEPLQTELYPASAPTITFTNDNGKTINSDTNHEDMTASDTYTPCATIKAPSEGCSARYGALVAIEYDATFNKKIDGSSYFESTDKGYLAAHSDNLTASMAYDQYKVMMWDGAVQDIDGDGVLDDGVLCDGKKVEVFFDVETTTETPVEDSNNIVFHWVPINKDLDADDMVLITGIYDEDNNLIAQATKNETLYTA